MKRLLIWTLIAWVTACAAGCTGRSRPYATSEYVITFEDAVWVEAEGRLVLVSATWRPEKPLTMEDIRYCFRRGVVLTPGFAADLLRTSAKENP